MASTKTTPKEIYSSVSPIDEELLNVEQAVKALESDVNDALLAVNASIKALRKSMTSNELVVTPRQFANQEQAEYKEIRL